MAVNPHQPMPNTPKKETTIMTNFRWPASTRNRLARIVKERRAAEPDKAKKKLINRTSVARDIIESHPVNWKA